ncbi:MAG TPA: 50S ribosomal protein L6 [Desulfobacteraceae bacterium]|nr:50S ribosomal protein L6 [Desulfobacteraceae bacterium]HPJ66713.1 50S ribosomal protein L6 [Desulfobacteraceae bacterium]HPQ26926.1 50S ribosomal protein L6 [Desulfobacteraceae bacterium]
MSRIGKVPIPIPKGVEIRLEGDSLKVNGPRGELTRKIHPKVQVNTDGEKIEVSVYDSTKESKSLHGLFRVLISNMITGVSSGFERSLEIVGVGYRAELKDRTVVFNIGYSHPVNYELPEGIDARIDKMKISLSGNDKELLGKTAAKIRSFRKPEPYKGKGIKYSEEMIRRKAGKSGVK